MEKLLTLLPLFIHMCLIVFGNTEKLENITYTQETSPNKTEISTTSENTSGIILTASYSTHRPSSSIPTQTSVLPKSTKRTLTEKTVAEKQSTVVTKPTYKKSIPVVTNLPSKTRRKKKRAILLIVLLILCGMFFIFAFVVPYLKKKIQMSKLRHHLVPVYSFEQVEAEDWETELLTEHRDKAQQTETTRATIVREIPQSRIASDPSYTI